MITSFIIRNGRRRLEAVRIGEEHAALAEVAARGTGVALVGFAMPKASSLALGKAGEQRGPATQGRTAVESAGGMTPGGARP